MQITWSNYLVALLLIGWLSKGRFGEGMPETSMMKEVFELKICAFALGALSCGGGAARVGCAGQARFS